MSLLGQQGKRPPTENAAFGVKGIQKSFPGNVPISAYGGIKLPKKSTTMGGVVSTTDETTDTPAASPTLQSGPGAAQLSAANSAQQDERPWTNIKRRAAKELLGA